MVNNWFSSVIWIQDVPYELFKFRFHRFSAIRTKFQIVNRAWRNGPIVAAAIRFESVIRKPAYPMANLRLFFLVSHNLDGLRFFGCVISKFKQPISKNSMPRRCFFISMSMPFSNRRLCDRTQCKIGRRRPLSVNGPWRA